MFQIIVQLNSDRRFEYLIGFWNSRLFQGIDGSNKKNGNVQSLNFDEFVLRAKQMIDSIIHASPIFICK